MALAACRQQQGRLLGRLLGLRQLASTSHVAQQGGEAGGKRDGTIDFGFKEVPLERKQGLVGEVFSSVAPSYDVMNDLMSGGLHRLWKDRLVQKLRPWPGMQHLDVAGGTGDVAFRVLDAMQQAAQQGSRRAPPTTAPAAAAAAPGSASAAHPSSSSSPSSSSGGFAPGTGSQQQHMGSGGGRVTVCDINAAMLAEGRRKAAARGVPEGAMAWVEGNAESLPFEDASMDSYTVAFGIRNVTDRPAALREAYRVLKPGGRFMCLEFSKVIVPRLQQLYDLYSFNVIPQIGRLVANDAESYQYLVESIRMFPDQEAFAQMVEDAGFRGVEYENLSAGVVAIHSGFKL